jgi:hypothetical protein
LLSARSAAEIARVRKTLALMPRDDLPGELIGAADILHIEAGHR